MSEAARRDPSLLPVEAEQKRRYDERYFSVYREDPKRAAMYREERDRIERLKPGGRILDVGCGIGHFLAEFSPEKWDRYGTDIADLAIQEARARGIKVKDYAQAYDYPQAHFDVIVFRGSLQLIPTPFSVIQTCVQLLAPGGYIVFLSTPNSNSPYYRRFKTLPFLTPHANFLIPSDIMMRDALQNFGLEVVDIRFPYLGGPYARPVRDHLLYLLSFVGIKRRFPFWRSSMEIYARKPERPR
jgi:SAM-dependent methyltransferase